MVADLPEAVVELTLPSDPRFLALVRVVVGAAAAAVPSLSEARIADLKLVATELFANAMEANWRAAAPRAVDHAVGDSSEVGVVSRHAVHESAVGRSAPVRVRCRATATEVTLTVSDSGPGLDAGGDPHPPVDDPSRLDHERGLGIPLIQYLADEVDYVSDADGTRATAVLADHVGERRAP